MWFESFFSPHVIFPSPFSNLTRIKSRGKWLIVSILFRFCLKIAKLRKVKVSCYQCGSCTAANRCNILCFWFCWLENPGTTVIRCIGIDNVTMQITRNRINNIIEIMYVLIPRTTNQVIQLWKEEWTMLDIGQLETVVNGKLRPFPVVEMINISFFLWKEIAALLQRLFFTRGIMILYSQRYTAWFIQIFNFKWKQSNSCIQCCIFWTARIIFFSLLSPEYIFHTKNQSNLMPSGPHTEFCKPVMWNR